MRIYKIFIICVLLLAACSVPPAAQPTFTARLTLATLDGTSTRYVYSGQISFNVAAYASGTGNPLNIGDPACYQLENGGECKTEGLEKIMSESTILIDDSGCWNADKTQQGYTSPAPCS